MVNKEEIKKYLNLCQQANVRFYVHKKGSEPQAIKFEQSQIYVNNNLVDYFLQTEQEGHTIFVQKPNTEIKKVSFNKINE